VGLPITGGHLKILQKSYSQLAATTDGHRWTRMKTVWESRNMQDPATNSQHPKHKRISQQTVRRRQRAWDTILA
jgi:hypothetical protein